MSLCQTMSLSPLWLWLWLCHYETWLDFELDYVTMSLSLCHSMYDCWCAWVTANEVKVLVKCTWWVAMSPPCEQATFPGTTRTCWRVGPVELTWTRTLETWGLIDEGHHEFEKSWCLSHMIGQWSVWISVKKVLHEPSNSRFTSLEVLVNCNLAIEQILSLYIGN